MDDFSVLLLLNNSSISLDDKETFDAVARVKCMAGHMNKLFKKANHKCHDIKKYIAINYALVSTRESATYEINCSRSFGIFCRSI